MQQSNVIFGAILIAFIVFITVRGELPAYLSLLRGSSNGQDDTTGSLSAGGLSTDNANVIGNIGTSLNTGKTALDNAKTILDLFGG